MYKNNVIDLNSFRKSQSHKKKRSLNGPLSPPIDMIKRRKSILRRERRRVKRILLTEFISASIVIPQRGLQSVNLYDISKNGLSFDLELDQGIFKVNEELAMRFYLNNHTYFPFFVKVTHLNTLQKEGIRRIGAHFIKNTFKSIALEHFVKFIETVSDSLKNDKGDVLVTN